MKNLILVFGPNGVGKGTLVSHLAKEFDYYHLNMGHLIRQWIINKKRPDLQEDLNNGILISDEIVEEILEFDSPNFISAKGMFLEGFPRRKSQIKSLRELCKSLNSPISGIIILDAPLEVILERVSQRIMDKDCNIYHWKFNPPPKNIPRKELVVREDDRPEVVKKRYEEYISNTKGCLEVDFLQNVPVCNIDGTKSIDEVFKEAEKFVKKLEAK